MKTLATRGIQALMVAVLIGAATFAMMRSLPGDAAYRIAAGRYGYDNVDSAAADAVREELGIGGPALPAFINWLSDLLRFDFGTSLVTGQPVIEEIGHQLGGVTVARCGCGAIISADRSTARHSRRSQAGRRSGSRLVGHVDRAKGCSAIPDGADPHLDPGRPVALAARGRSWRGAAFHPARTRPCAWPCRRERPDCERRDGADRGDAILQLCAVEGLTPRQTLFRHGLRNVSVPLLTYLGLQFVTLVEGVVVVESIFGWPGIGHALVHAIFSRDVPMVQGTALVLGLSFVLVNALIDLAAQRIDPRGAA